jgi:hypothetical protein
MPKVHISDPKSKAKSIIVSQEGAKGKVLDAAVKKAHLLYATDRTRAFKNQPMRGTLRLNAQSKSRKIFIFVSTRP